MPAPSGRGRAVVRGRRPARGRRAGLVLAAPGGRAQPGRAGRGAPSRRDRERPAETQLRRAEATTRIAVEALDRVFGRFTSGRGAGSGGALAGSDLGLPAQPILSEDTARLLEELLPLYSSLSGQGESADPALRRKADQALVQVGRIRSRLGQHEAARQAYQEAALRWASAEAATPDEVEARAIALAGALDGLGQTLQSLGDAEAAQATYEEALGHLRAASSKRASVELLREQGATMLLALESRGPRSDALPVDGPEHGREDQSAWQARSDLLDAAFADLETARDRDPDDPDTKFLLARVHRERAGLFAAARREGGREEMAAAEGLLDELVRDHPTALEYRYELARTLCRVPHHRVPEDERRRLEDQLERAVDILEDLSAENPREVGLAADLAHALHLYAGFLADGDRPGAEGMHRRAVGVQSYLLERMPDSLPTALWLSVYREQFGEYLLHGGKRDDAERQIEANLEMLERLAAKDPELVHPYLDRAREAKERLPPRRR